MITEQQGARPRCLRVRQGVASEVSDRVMWKRFKYTSVQGIVVEYYSVREASSDAADFVVYAGQRIFFARSFRHGDYTRHAEFGSGATAGVGQRPGGGEVRGHNSVQGLPGGMQWKTGERTGWTPPHTGSVKASGLNVT